MPRGARRAQRRLRLRRREALPRLPRPRAALGAHDRAGPLRRQLREPHALPARRSSTGIRAEAPGPARSACASRPSTWCPYRKDADGRGVPETATAPATASAFGLLARRATWTRRSTTRARCCALLREPRRPLGLHRRAGSPYYNPHVQRPALFPPSDGYLPPEDPLRGRRAPDRGDGAAQGGVPRPGVRRLGLQLPAGVAAERRPARACARAWPTSSASAAWCSPIPSCRPTCWPAGRSTASGICRTFSDCTTAPRKGLVSGCYPLDPLLRRAARGRAAEGGQGSAAGMTSARPDAARRRHQALARRHRLPRALLDRRLRPLRPAVLLRLLRARPRLDAAAGHVRQRLRKLVVGPLFGFFAGVVVDRFGPRRLMLVGHPRSPGSPSSASAAPRRSSPSTPSTC